MNMSPAFRKFTFTAHVISSVGWLGAVVTFMVLAIVGSGSKDIEPVRGAYLMMELIAWYVLVPLAFASLVTGLVQALGTSWGLFRHYWVSMKFVLTIFATTVLLLKTQLISTLSYVAANAKLSADDLGRLRTKELVVHATGGLVVLLFITVLSVYKPWGLTVYGRRKQKEQRRVPSTEPAPAHSDAITTLKTETAFRTRTPRWVYVVGIHAFGLVLLFLVLHLHGGMPGH